MGSRQSKARDPPQDPKDTSSTTNLLTKEKEKDWQAPPPTPTPSASPPAPPPAYKDETDDDDKAVVPAKRPEPKVTPPKWLDKFVYTYAGTVTIVCADGKTLKAKGRALTNSSPRIARALTHTHEEDPIYEVRLNNKVNETFPIVYLYTQLLEGKELPLPKANIPFALWQLGDLLRVHDAHKEKVVLGYIISNWLSKPEIRDLVEFPPMLFLVGDILDIPSVCADVLRAYANRTLQQYNKGENVWNLDFWAEQNVKCCSERYKNALRDAYADCGKTPDGRIDADKLVKGFEQRIGKR
ncbi:hypothetical protein IAT40_002957 [Kwoniella sp. CBS 6097]